MPEVIKPRSTSNLSVSVVIPTAGLVDIRPVLKMLDESSAEALISEVIVVGPRENIHLLEKQAAAMLSNIRYTLNLLVSPKKGQVYQRLLGFRIATAPLVLQLDDDVVLSSEGLAEMRESLIRKGTGNAVGPIFYDGITGCPAYRYNSFSVRGFLNNVVDFIVFDLPWGIEKLGKASALKKAYPIDPTLAKESVVCVEWLAGGCVLMFKHDLVLEDFYRYAGKAFAEDLIHSKIRRGKGIIHWQCRDAAVITDFSSRTPNSVKDLVRELLSTKSLLIREWRLSAELGANVTLRLKLVSYLLLLRLYHVSRYAIVKSFVFFSNWWINRV